MLFRSPQMFFFDQGQHVLGMQDLGTAKDFDFLYGSEKNLTKDDETFLITYLSELHRLPVSGPDFHNRRMRDLNHAYIFELPFKPNEDADVDAVTPGLLELARVIQQDEELRDIALALGKAYLEDGQYLIHGDFYPRSWIQTSAGSYVIDPEFGHLGKREFDLGVFLAHLFLSGISHGIGILELHYPQLPDCDQSLIFKFCGVEIIRRLIHVTQLPIRNDLGFKKNLLTFAVTAIKTGKLAHRP